METKTPTRQATKNEILASLARLIASRKIAASTAIRVYPHLLRMIRVPTSPLRTVVRMYDTRKAGN